MEGYGSDFSSGGAGGKMDSGAIMEQVKVQIAVANAQELLQVKWANQLSKENKRMTLTLTSLCRRVGQYKVVVVVVFILIRRPFW